MDIRVDEELLLEQFPETMLLDELGRRLIKGTILTQVNKTTGQAILKHYGTDVEVKIPPSINLSLEGDALRDAYMCQVFNDIYLVSEYKDATQFIEECCPTYEGMEAVNLYHRYQKEHQDMLQVMTPLDIEILCKYYGD